MNHYSDSEFQDMYFNEKEGIIDNNHYNIQIIGKLSGTKEVIFRTWGHRQPAWTPTSRYLYHKKLYLENFGEVVVVVRQPLSFGRDFGNKKAYIYQEEIA